MQQTCSDKLICDTHTHTHTNWLDVAVNVVQDELTECDKLIEIAYMFTEKGKKTSYEHTWRTHPPTCAHTNTKPHWKLYADPLLTQQSSDTHMCRLLGAHKRCTNKPGLTDRPWSNEEMRQLSGGGGL